MDESRKQFQSWFEEWFGEPPLTPWNELWCDDGYSAEDIDHMWDAWKESRAAIEIELLDINQYLAELENKTLSLAFRRLAEGVRAGDITTIRAAGIKVKE
ncbi:hypothetical protein HF762_003693 [Salmonella enterica]|nr:hypothetical protein [Salmonella enterica]EDT7383466.1 hypothetical protein [Salmonella enterica subsp. enterica]EFA3529341.1 hypothetical protein [Salmonella enterica]EGJ0364707.1 hypothetical protein [Salmonella enterica]EGL9660028.1 hypothetical protein [Salmonella enterica]